MTSLDEIAHQPVTFGQDLAGLFPRPSLVERPARCHRKSVQRSFELQQAPQSRVLVTQKLSLGDGPTRARHVLRRSALCFGSLDSTAVVAPLLHRVQYERVRLRDAKPRFKNSTGGAQV